MASTFFSTLFFSPLAYSTNIKCKYCLIVSAISTLTPEETICETAQRKKKQTWKHMLFTSIKHIKINMTQFFLLYENISNIAMYHKPMCHITNTSTNVESMNIPSLSSNNCLIWMLSFWIAVLVHCGRYPQVHCEYLHNVFFMLLIHLGVKLGIHSWCGTK